MVELSPMASPNTFSQSFAGDVFNTGVYLKRCLDKANVSFLSVIGKDTISQRFFDFMVEHSINTEHLCYLQDKSLGLYLINVDKEGERSFTYWRENSAARELMKFVDNNTNHKSFDEVDVVFFSGISLAILLNHDLQGFWLFIEKLKQQGCQIVFDPNYRKSLWSSTQQARTAIEKAYSLADVALSGLDDHIELYNHQTIDEVATYIESLGVKEIIIKNGDKGVLVSIDNERTQMRINPVENVVDTTSAGDAFNGGYLSARYKEMSVEIAVIYAAQLAGHVIQHKGAIVPLDTYHFD